MGGDELRTFSNPGFACFDFNQWNPHNNNVDALVDSFFVNDPYYPRPGMEFWDEFKDGYLLEADRTESAWTWLKPRWRPRLPKKLQKARVMRWLSWRAEREDYPTAIRLFKAPMHYLPMEEETTMRASLAFIIGLLV
ncbi:hypothetical protein SELMODRAFT_407274 [Selaginella moellendorffii]|uniref:DUF3669 domain-containing protein n=1 Tax=Selaginella moellendorffii TaxID=88036 RepID=D8R4H6_SELML|nr:hypothetical protein SELMODRAFT_407274 [Selaginella moellendorffii]